MLFNCTYLPGDTLVIYINAIHLMGSLSSIFWGVNLGHSGLVLGSSLVYLQLPMSCLMYQAIQSCLSWNKNCLCMASQICGEKVHYVGAKLFIPKLNTFDNVTLTKTSNMLSVATKCSSRASKHARKEHLLMNMVMQVPSSCNINCFTFSFSGQF